MLLGGFPCAVANAISVCGRFLRPLRGMVLSVSGGRDGRLVSGVVDGGSRRDGRFFVVPGVRMRPGCTRLRGGRIWRTVMQMGIWLLHAALPPFQSQSTRLPTVVNSPNGNRLPASGRFALGSRPWREFAWKRILRLGVPVVTLGWFLLNPIQIYIEASTNQNYHCPPFEGSFWQFLPHTFSGTYGVDGYFSWSAVHLWYLSFLLIFTLLSLPLFLCLRGPRGKRALDTLVGILCRPGVVFLAGLGLCLTELFIPHSVPYLGNNEGGWLLGTHWLVLIYGFVLGCEPRLREAMRRQCWLALGLAVITLVPLTDWAYTMGDGWNGSPVLLFHWAWRTVNGWFWVVAILGLGTRYLNRPHRFLPWPGRLCCPFTSCTSR